MCWTDIHYFISHLKNTTENMHTESKVSLRIDDSRVVTVVRTQQTLPTAQLRSHCHGNCCYGRQRRELQPGTRGRAADTPRSPSEQSRTGLGERVCHTCTRHQVTRTIVHGVRKEGLLGWVSPAIIGCLRASLPLDWEARGDVGESDLSFVLSVKELRPEKRESGPESNSKKSAYLKHFQESLISNKRQGLPQNSMQVVPEAEPILRRLQRESLHTKS